MRAQRDDKEKSNPFAKLKQGVNPSGVQLPLKKTHFLIIFLLKYTPKQAHFLFFCSNRDPAYCKNVVMATAQIQNLRKCSSSMKAASVTKCNVITSFHLVNFFKQNCDL